MSVLNPKTIAKYAYLYCSLLIDTEILKSQTGDAGKPLACE